MTSNRKRRCQAILFKDGAWKAFLERGLKFDAVAGSSIGALNGAFVCHGDWDSARDFWTELTKTNVLRPDYSRLERLATAVLSDLGLLLLPLPSLGLLRVLKYSSSVVKFASQHGTLGRILKEGLVDLEKFKPLVKRYLDMDKVVNGPTSLYVAVSLSLGSATLRERGHYLRLQDFSPDEAWKILAASMAVPFVFRSVPFQGKRYLDGGMSRWLPMEPLWGRECSEVIAVSTKPKVRYVRKPGQDGNITIIQPANSLGRFPVATFRFTEETVKYWMQLGYQDASRVLDISSRKGVK